MAVFNVNGQASENVYGISGSALLHAYDIEGIDILSSIDPLDWSSISQQFRSNIDDAVTYAKTYLANHNAAYAFPVLTDVHDKFYNEPNYVLYNHSNTFDKFLFLGDIANSYSTTQLDNAVSYMNEAETVDVLALIGNHEFGEYVDGDDLPKLWYQTLLPETAVVMSADALVYYFDDAANHARYIVLDSCTPIYKSSGTQLLTKDQLEFFAGALDSSNGKDIILLNHSMAQSYYLVTDTEKETSISTTGVTNRGTMDAIINAYINRTSYTFADDSSVSHTHDYSDATGSFIGYFTGHTHHAGYNNANGYHAFTCPSSYYNSDAGMSVFVIDPYAKKIIWLIAYKNQSTYGMYEYSY